MGSLLMTDRHVNDDALTTRRHHGKGKLTGRLELGNVNVVLTTYQTVAGEWKSEERRANSILFSVRWKRIILDEGILSYTPRRRMYWLTRVAHFIRNGIAKMTQAICALDALNRWAVTATPVQNRLGDLVTLLRFIRAYPYADPNRFDADIIRHWKTASSEQAVGRLKRLSACLVLRRPKNSISLPLRHDLQCCVDFNRQERLSYDEIRNQAISKIDEAMAVAGSSKTGVYVNMLQQIESLRLFCNLGLHYHTRHERMLQFPADPMDWATVAQRTFNSQWAMSSIKCWQCASVLELSENMLDDATESYSAQFSSCSNFTCADCAYRTRQNSGATGCAHRPSCPKAPVSTSRTALEELPDPVIVQGKIPSIGIPSKIAALVTDMKSIPLDVKW
jgi:hypothetical protein